MSTSSGLGSYSTTWSEWSQEIGQSDDSTETAVPSAEGTEAETVGRQHGARPTKPCRPFGTGEHRRFWQGPGGWTCATCHPPSDPDVDVWELPPAEAW
jgi:hypothetical protein